MSIDLEQFHQVFFEESIEGLDIMESSLMDLDPSEIDSETINAIFRCAHSIKGGSATFGFTSIAEFTHVLETLLDQVRSGDRGLSTADIDLYLQSVDCMREMLELLEQGEDGETETSKQLHTQFLSLLNGESTAEETADSAASAEQSPSAANASSAEAAEPIQDKAWLIRFSPYAEVFKTGNDPLRNIQALADLGEYQVQCDIDKLPNFDSYDAELSYLKWEITLHSDCSEQQIAEIFEWMEDECDLDISQINVGQNAGAENVASTSDGAAGWTIRLVPNAEVLKTGNDPLKIIDQLAKLGQLTAEVDTSRLPAIGNIDAENCYLSWNIVLADSSASFEEVDTLFEWIKDEAEIEISPIGTDGAQNAAAAQQADAEIDKANAEACKQDANPSKQAAPSNKKESKPAAKKAPNKAGGADTSSIRVGIDKVDSLINMVGELVITQSMLGQLSEQVELEKVPNLVEGLNQLEQNTRELQESVMKIRMLPISFVFSRFPRMVRDLSKTLGKSVELVMSGESTELDKTVMEKIGDPLVHLVRNAADHGLETPEERSALGKNPTGTITLNAFHQSGNVVIEIIDDGKGLDRQKLIEKASENGLITEKDAESMSDEQVYDLIFQPGFSTAKTVSDVSGRGVGMDVVKRNIQDLNGVVEISSQKNVGSTITIKLPLTLAILDGQLVRIGDQTYIFPLTSIIESMQCQPKFISQVAGGCSVFKLRDEYVPIVELYKAFSIQPDSMDIEDALLVVVESEGEKVGIVVDELQAQQQVVIKSLEQNYRKVDGVSGATILGDGTVALILDIPGITKLYQQQMGVSAHALANNISHFDTTRQTDVTQLAAG